MRPFLKYTLQSLTLAAVAMLSGTAMAANELDPALAGDGTTLLDFGGEERALASCPAAQGKQLLVMRSGNDQILTTRLLWDGSVDPAFNNGQPVRLGFQLVDLNSTSAALCRPDGNVWLAMRYIPSGTQENILLLAIGADGLPVPGTFGAAGGIAEIDLDNYAADLLDREEPLGFNNMPNGGALLTGRVDVTGGRRPFVVKFSDSSLIAGVAILQPPGFSGYQSATAAAVGPGGGIWVVGDGDNNGRRAFRMYLDPQNLELQFTQVGVEAGVTTVGGGLVRNGVMVVGATQRIGNAPAEPRLLVFRDNGEQSMLELPLPAPLDAGVSTGLNALGSTIMPLPGNKILYAIGAEAFDGENFLGYNGWYFARAVIGANAAEDHIDTSFGELGQQVLSVRSGDPSCAGLRNRQLHARIYPWQGLPTIVGTIDRQCNPDAQEDAVVIRLRGDDALFAHGFE
ncbi:MAG: hypothetical protein KAY04_00155 [Burkholderiales bacterium]|nr:hypothetical protein [Burkholderiales bacterium]